MKRLSEGDFSMMFLRSEEDAILFALKHLSNGRFTEPEEANLLHNVLLLFHLFRETQKKNYELDREASKLRGELNKIVKKWTE